MRGDAWNCCIRNSSTGFQVEPKPIAQRRTDEGERERPRQCVPVDLGRPQASFESSPTSDTTAPAAEGSTEPVATSATGLATDASPRSAEARGERSGEEFSGAIASRSAIPAQSAIPAGDASQNVVVTRAQVEEARTCDRASTCCVRGSIRPEADQRQFTPSSARSNRRANDAALHDPDEPRLRVLDTVESLEPGQGKRKWAHRYEMHVE